MPMRWLLPPTAIFWQPAPQPVAPLKSLPGPSWPRGMSTPQVRSREPHYIYIVKNHSLPRTQPWLRTRASPRVAKSKWSPRAQSILTTRSSWQTATPTAGSSGSWPSPPHLLRVVWSRRLLGYSTAPTALIPPDRQPDRRA